MSDKKESFKNENEEDILKSENKEDLKDAITKESNNLSSEELGLPEEDNKLDSSEIEFEEEENNEQKLQEEIELLRDEKLRVLADMENLRKRSEKDRADSIRYGSINLARDMLSPDDNLTRALDAIPKEEKNSETIKNLIDGLKMVQKEFLTILEKYGVKKIDALNKKFDHNFHQAMVEIEDDKAEPGIVVQELQKGYIMHDRLLRPSMVGVSKKTNKNKEKN